MPTLEENQKVWGQSYDWSSQGNEWSGPWGNPEKQWYSSLLPRIFPFLPARSILEIAPGFGRWTEFLRGHAEKLILVDMSEKCIDACKTRFSDDSRLSFFVNDGKSLNFIPDRSLDFVFSFDSLVHAEADVIETYLKQISKKLKPGGAGFLHHSNLGEYQWYFRLLTQTGRLGRILVRMGILEPLHNTWRAPSMTARKFRQYAHQAGLVCLSQEKVNWNSRRLIDCFSTFALAGESWHSRTPFRKNPDFMREAGLAKSIPQAFFRTNKQ